LKIIVFYIENKPYGIRIDYLLQVLDGNAPITKLPRAPKYILGIINFEGVLVPIVDACEFFGLKRTERSRKLDAKIIVVHYLDIKAGLLIEGNTELKEEPFNIDGLEIIDIENILSCKK